jgi:hypothetical protein
MLIERKSKIPPHEIGVAFHWARISPGTQIQGIESNAAASWCKPLITPTLKKIFWLQKLSVYIKDLNIN